MQSSLVIPCPSSLIVIESESASMETFSASASQAFATASDRTAGTLLYRLTPRWFRVFSPIVRLYLAIMLPH